MALISNLFKSLNLTDEQKAELKKILADLYTKKVQKKFDEVTKLKKDLKAKFEKKALKVLTAKQKARLTKMDKEKKIKRKAKKLKKTVSKKKGTAAGNEKDDNEEDDDD